MTLTEAQRAALRETFDDIDADKSGTLSKDELRKVIDLFAKKKAPSTKQFNRIFKAADTNGDGVISFDEFVAAMEQVQLSQEDELRLAFDAFDTDNSNTIEPKEFEQACGKLGIVLSKTDIEVLFDAYDLDTNQKIDFEEFKSLMQSLEAY
jgi:calcium-dependent protein kinase